MTQSEGAPRSALAEFASPPADPALAAREPNDLDAIRALRRPGPRRLWTTLKEDVYFERLAGALTGRMAGCTLGVPVDDDLIYTLLGLLIADEHGLDFSTEDVGQTWIKYLPFACTAEDVALQNIKVDVRWRSEPASKRFSARPASRAGMRGGDDDQDRIVLNGARACIRRTPGGLWCRNSNSGTARLEATMAR